MAFALLACGVGGAAELSFERGDGGARGQHTRGVWRRAVAAFSMSHPAVPALYMVLTLGLTMFSMQPVLIALSLAGGWRMDLRRVGLPARWAHSAGSCR